MIPSKSGTAQSLTGQDPLSEEDEVVDLPDETGPRHSRALLLLGLVLLIDLFARP